jgi:hypothetical protein
MCAIRLAVNKTKNQSALTRAASSEMKALEKQTPVSSSAIRQKTLSAFLAFVLTFATAAHVVGAIISEDFSNFPLDTCYPGGTTVNSWRSVFAGFGCNSTVLLNGNASLKELPAAPVSPNETHSALVVSPSVRGNIAVRVDLATSRQLRTGSAPNAWEVAWVLWNYTDNSHFYYFIPKPNGWEIGKADPAYPNGQRFLTSGSSPKFPIGVWYQLKIIQSGQTIQVSVNGTLLVTFTDRERPYSSGRIGLYTEDAEAYFDNIIVMPATSNGKK